MAFLTKTALVAGIVLATALTFSCSDDKDEPGGGQANPGDTSAGTVSAWMPKNLNVDVTGSRCYGDEPANCTRYGRLYDWATAMGLPSKCNSVLSTSDADCRITTPRHKGICPAGYHIPTNAEWDALVAAAGGSSVAGKHLRAKEGWEDCGPSGSGKSYSCEDSYGFSALPGGLGGDRGISFVNVGSLGYWWSASEGSSNGAYYWSMLYSIENVQYGSHGKSLLLSVRCLQD